MMCPYLLQMPTESFHVQITVEVRRSDQRNANVPHDGGPSNSRHVPGSALLRRAMLWIYHLDSDPKRGSTRPLHNFD